MLLFIVQCVLILVSSKVIRKSRVQMNLKMMNDHEDEEVEEDK
jgi:hypothetical protein